MNLRKQILKLLIFLCGSMALAGCISSLGNQGDLQGYSVAQEVEWIRNGEPIEFDGEKWFPLDEVDILLDSEVYLLGEYHGVKFFVEKVDIRPFNRLYTKFAQNKFRAFEKRN